jgi:PAS domain S-box-containing protein
MTEHEARALGQWLDRGPTLLWTARPNGELDWVNTAMLVYFERSFEQMTRWEWVEVLHPDDVEPCGERWSLSLESGEPYEMEFRLRRADGTFRWHVARAVPYRDERGRIEKWIGITVEVEGLSGWVKSVSV